MWIMQLVTYRTMEPISIAQRMAPRSIQNERIRMQLKIAIIVTLRKNLSLSPSSRRFIKENDRIADDMAVTTNIISDENTSKSFIPE